MNNDLIEFKTLCENLKEYYYEEYHYQKVIDEIEKFVDEHRNNPDRQDDKLFNTAIAHLHALLALLFAEIARDD